MCKPNDVRHAVERSIFAVTCADDLYRPEAPCHEDNPYREVPVPRASQGHKCAPVLQASLTEHQGMTCSPNIGAVFS